MNSGETATWPAANPTGPPNQGARPLSYVGTDPYIYPALLSHIAKAFISLIQLGTHTKDGLEFPDCFHGKQGVDVISKIIKAKDRNIAILLGRALDSQGFFHDVSWAHRLRDSSHEFYRFKESVNGTKPEIPSGVFTLLADCFSPTCSRQYPCYSIICPRRFESKLMTINSARSSKTKQKPEKLPELWSTSVSKEILESVSKNEIGRQEVIFEIITTETEFVMDLQNTIKHYIEPLKTRNIISPERRDEFIAQVFSNLVDLYNINSKFLKKLLSRQSESPIVDKVGDIFVNIAHEFYPYVEYGAQQIYAKNILDEEKQNNPELVQFLKETEKLSHFRKLPIESFLARPTTRMGRYPLLLKPVMEKAPENHPDRSLVPQALTEFRAILSNINIEAGKAENIVKLEKLQTQIKGFEEGEDLRLNKEGRKIIRDGKLILKKNNDAEMIVFLFDHIFLVTKKKENKMSYKVVKKPIPLQLLIIVQEPGTNPAVPDSKGHMISFHVPSRYGGPFALYALTHADKVTWIDAIEKQKAVLNAQKRRFEISIIVDKVFLKSNPINCACLYKSHMIIGTESGLFVGKMDSDRGDSESPSFVKVMDLEKIYQVDVIVKIDNLLALADKVLLSYPLRQIIELAEGISQEKIRPKKIGSAITFFRQGICSNIALVCTVKSTALQATIKVMTPVGLGVSNLHGKIGKMFKTTNEGLRLEKEFYIPSESKSIHFLNTKLCVGCTKGFEVVELDTLATQALLDPSDPNLEFVLKRDAVRPISIFRLKDGSFFLCYNDFGFFIDKMGCREKKDIIHLWSGNPTHFSFSHPYIIAYEPSFIEIRHLESGELEQIIHTSNLRVLSLDSSLVHLAADSTESPDHQLLFKLKQLPVTDL